MTADNGFFPRLRHVEFFPVPVEKGMHIAVRDPLAYTEQILVLSPLACFIAAHLDGQSGVTEIQASFARQFDKQILSSDTIMKVVQSLEENFLLEDKRFLERMHKIDEEFKQSATREAAHSDGVYSNDPEALCKQLDSYFTQPDGPGDAQLPSAQGEISALVAPHIDFTRGGPAYAWAYREILSRRMADLYVILGVAHISPPTPFVLTDKSYATPLGPAEADKDLARALIASLDWNPKEYEIIHRKEHSVEFQALYLRYCARKRSQNFKVLPILVSGAAGDETANGGKGDPRTTSFLSAIAEKLRAYSGKVCLVAGVDLCHVGRRFGDEFDVTPERLDWMKREDHASLEFVLKKDPDGWRHSVTPERKVCGLGALYALSWLMRELYPKSEGKLLHYGHAPDPSGGEVSFASLRFIR
jgi:AmmeMemoRadiSam system protein B